MMSKWLKAVIDPITKALHESNFFGIRYYVKQEISENISVHDGAKENHIVGDVLSFFVEAGKDGKRCYTYFNQPFAVDDIVKQMNESFCGAVISYEYKELTDSYVYGEVDLQPLEQKYILGILSEAEERAYRQEGIATVDHCGYTKESKLIYLLDESGHCMSDRNTLQCAKLSVIARKDQDVFSAWGDVFGKQISIQQMLDLSEKTSKRAANGLGARSIKSGKYAAIFSNGVFSELLEAYLPVFFADMVQDKMSLLEGKLNQPIACELLMMCEEPNALIGQCRRSMDDEGILVSEKRIIENGRLKTFLYNGETAKKENKASTGNGFKDSIIGDVGIKVTNMRCFTKQPSTLIELKQSMSEGVYITGIDGVFAGVNIHNGDFSLIAKGIIITKGQEKEPFCDVTVAGNFFQLLKDIQKMGMDECCTPKGYASVICPSILIKEVTISGI